VPDLFCRQRAVETGVTGDRRIWCADNWRLFSFLLEKPRTHVKCF